MAPKTRSPRRRVNGDEGPEGVHASKPPNNSRRHPDRQTVAGRVVHRPDGLAVIVQLDLIDGVASIDVRLWRRGPKGAAPTSRGFRISPDQADELAFALSDLAAASTGSRNAPD